MTQEMKGLLLEDRWAPVTSTMGFLELGVEQAPQLSAERVEPLPCQGPPAPPAPGHPTRARAAWRSSTSQRPLQPPAR